MFLGVRQVGPIRAKFFGVEELIMQPHLACCIRKKQNKLNLNLARSICRCKDKKLRSAGHELRKQCQSQNTVGGRWENGGWVEGVEHRAPLSLNLNLQRKHRERADEDPLQVLREERRCLQNSALLIIIISG